MSDALAWLQDYLRKLDSLIKPHLNSDFKFTLQGFVSKFGKVYQPAELPPSFRMGIPKHCFGNCGRKALRSKRLVYVEGFAYSHKLPIPIHHAWLTYPGSKNAIDVTSTIFDAYIGVPFTTEFLRKKWQEHPEIASLLCDNHDFDLFKTEESEIEKILVREE